MWLLALRWFRPARLYVAVLPLRLGVWASDHRRLSLVALNPGVLGGQAPCVSLRSVLLPRIAWGLQVDRVISELGRLELSGSGCPGPVRFLRSVLPSRLAGWLRWWPGEASDVPASLHTGVCGGCANVLGTLALHSSLVRGAWTGTPGQAGAGPCLHSPASPRSSRTASCTRDV